jgi:hypothetical protein
VADLGGRWRTGTATRLPGWPSAKENRDFPPRAETTRNEGGPGGPLRNPPVARIVSAARRGKVYLHWLHTLTRAWKAKELWLLGKTPDPEIAARTGRGTGAARQKREELGIPNPASRKWTPEELALPDRGGRGARRGPFT